MIAKPGAAINDPETHSHHSIDFAREHYDISDTFNFNELKGLNNICDTFLTGSDQLWNYGISKNFGKTFYLDFVKDSKRKIAYSTSFGHAIDFAPEDERIIISRLLSRFDAISVREKDGVKICNEIYGVDATTVLDPIFLPDISLYYDLSKKSKLSLPNERYVLAYILDPTPEKRALLLETAHRFGCKLIVILDGFPWLFKKNKEALNLDGTLENLDAYDFLHLYINSLFIVTDSYHGSSFAIIFNKPFISIGNKRRGISRFNHLFELFSLKTRFTNKPANIINNDRYFEDINYVPINNLISLERERSLKWLEQALEIQKKHNVASIVDIKNCTGCAACTNICKTGALKLSPDQYGFYRSRVDESKCVNCGKCENICPAIELPRNENTESPRCYAFIAADKKLLYNSSSGGIFPLLATQVIKKNGTVCGVKWKDDFTVEHAMINNIADLHKLQKSKYLQSYIENNIYKKIKLELKNKKIVLFSGCPCQAAGLRAYLGKDYKKLFIIDILCGNAPSALFFKKYIDDYFIEPKLIYYEFRYKKYGWNADCIKLTFSDGSVQVRRGAKEDPYQSVYHNHTMTPHHCEQCKYQALPRIGDLTIGDFWGLGKKDPTIDATKGVSVILINNTKGETLFNYIPKYEIAVMKNVPIQWLGNNGYALKGAHNYASINRNNFYETIKNNLFKNALEQSKLK